MDKARMTELAEKASKGSKEAFSELYAECREPLKKYIIKQGASADEAEDVVSAAFVKAMESIADLREPAYFDTWLHTIAKNEFTASRRRENRAVRIDFGGAEDDNTNESVDMAAFYGAEEDTLLLPEDYAENEDVKRVIAGAVNSLSDEQRDTVFLYYYSELSVGQIAEQMNVPAGTVKSRLSSARSALKKHLSLLQKQGVALCVVPIGSILALAENSSGKAAAAAAATSAASGKVAVAAAAAIAAGTIGLVAFMSNGGLKGDKRLDSSSEYIVDESSEEEQDNETKIYVYDSEAESYIEVEGSEDDLAEPAEAVDIPVKDYLNGDFELDERFTIKSESDISLLQYSKYIFFYHINGYDAGDIDNEDKVLYAPLTDDHFEVKSISLQSDMKLRIGMERYLPNYADIDINEFNAYLTIAGGDIIAMAEKAFVNDDELIYWFDLEKWNENPKNNYTYTTLKDKLSEENGFENLGLYFNLDTVENPSKFSSLEEECQEGNDDYLIDCPALYFDEDGAYGVSYGAIMTDGKTEGLIEMYPYYQEDGILTIDNNTSIVMFSPGAFIGYTQISDDGMGWEDISSESILNALKENNIREIEIDPENPYLKMDGSKFYCHNVIDDTDHLIVDLEEL